MAHLQAYTLLSVILVSAISLVGVLFLALKPKTLQHLILELVAFSVGGLLGDVFIHMLPEINGSLGLNTTVNAFILSGFLFSFLVEKVIHWHHCHDESCAKRAHAKYRVKPFAFINLFGDLVHNFIDGVVIAAAYLASIQIGIATTLAVLLHEIPQEIGDFAILIHAGMPRWRALLLNFVTALAAVLGAVLTLSFSSRAEAAVPYLLPFAAGTFLYIAASDLIPELHKETRTWRSVGQLGAILAGVGVMGLLLFLG